MTDEPDLRTALKKLKDMTGSMFVAATLGRDGVLAYFKGEYIHASAFTVDCKDTTGAGDAFHGGFMYGLLAGLAVEETLRFANAVAGLKCRAIGARTALPTLAEVNQLLAQRV
jgi:sulfofructose kinase